MSFTDGKPFVFTEEDSKRRWGGRTNGLHCYICLKKFKAGDTVRWVYANAPGDRPHGNFMTCADCDGPDVKERFWAIMDPIRERNKVFGGD